MLGILGFETPLAVLILGLIIGMTYGLLAVGLVLVYRSNRIINFAHGEVGAFGAAVLGLAVTRWNVPYWVAFPGAMAVSAGVGALLELAVIRRLRRAPKLMSIVATLGFSQFLLFLGLAVNSQVVAANLYPQPAFLPEFDIGALHITPAYSGMIFLTPAVVIALTVFLRYTRLGIQMRAAAANPERARLSGVFASRMSSLSWAIAGAVSALTAVLLFPTRGFASAEAFGPALLLRALFAAVVARMSNLPTALVAGVALGVLEQVLLWNRPQGGLIEVVLFVIILAALLLQTRQGGREDEKGSWAAVEAWPPLPEAFTRVWTIRNLGRVTAGVALVAAVVIPALSTNRTSSVLVSIMSFSLVGLSVGIVTGLSGQLSLGQFAIAGIGAVASYHVVRRTGNFPVAFAAAGVAAGAVSVLIGIPALRIRGLMLAVSTLGFALVSSTWLFQQPWMLDIGVDPGRPVIGNLRLNTAKSYYFFTLVFLIGALVVARNLRSSGFGRSLIALRDNEDGARAFTIPATTRKLQAFAVAGVLAGIGGAVYGHGLSRISPDTFPPASSTSIVAMTVIGGIGILSGPLIGAVYIIGFPAFVPLDSAGLAASAFGWLLLILYFPGGLAQLLRPLRDRFVDWLAGRSGVDAVAARLDADAGEASSRGVDLALSRRTTEEPAPAGTVLLRAEEVAKRYGGVRAVDGVTLEVRSGEILGLIGPNGAGKTTLFELVSGFTRPDTGTIEFAGRNVSRLGPEARGRLGLIRSFQDAFLFPTMTVLDVVRLAHERAMPTSLWGSVLGVSEREKDARARELVSSMGLEPFRNKQIQELSTGTRRIAELACLIALEPTVLLLDEPSSGIAQRETEALGDLLLQVRAELQTTLVVIEHDIPLIMRVSDRVVAMESGKVLAAGTPEEVRNDAAVIEAYLGADPTAISRSGSLAQGNGRRRGRLAKVADKTGRQAGSRGSACREITQSGARCRRAAVVDGLCSQHAARATARS